MLVGSRGDGVNGGVCGQHFACGLKQVYPRNPPPQYYVWVTANPPFADSSLGAGNDVAMENVSVW